MSIVTRTGDDGSTSLYGARRVPKDSIRVEVYGTVDELNTILGMVLTYEDELALGVCEGLGSSQHLLFRVGGDVATPMEQQEKQERISEKHITILEEYIGFLESALPPMRSFILPGGSRAASLLHFARTVCRRAERHFISLKEQEEVNNDVGILLNRLSDYLFLAARKVNADAGVGDVEVEY